MYDADMLGYGMDMQIMCSNLPKGVQTCSKGDDEGLPRPSIPGSFYTSFWSLHVLLTCVLQYGVGCINLTLYQSIAKIYIVSALFT